jgi:hypothetical protein
MAVLALSIDKHGAMCSPFSTPRHGRERNDADQFNGGQLRDCHDPQVGDWRVRLFLA